jgi:hypothetical protein
MVTLLIIRATGRGYRTCRLAGLSANSLAPASEEKFLQFVPAGVITRARYSMGFGLINRWRGNGHPLLTSLRR